MTPLARRFSTAVLATSVILAAAACGSTTSTPAPAAPTQPVAAAPSAVAGATVPGSAAAPSAGAGSPAASSPNSAALLPDDVDGHQLTKGQFGGPDFAASGAVSQQMTDLLATLGRTAADMTLATADDPSRATDLNITAFQVRGVTVQAFLQAYLPMVRTTEPEAAISQTTRAGRAVYVIAGLTGTGPQVLLPSGDVLFVVTSATSSLVDDALAKLP